jgi:Tol biopolymer transport system component
MFSRDGTKFLFLRGGGTKGLYIVIANADGSDAYVVTEVNNGPDWVDWSPDGTRIAFLSRTLDRGEINIVNVDGSGLQTLDVGQPAHEFSWLPPDGHEIVFRGEQQVDSDPPPAILAVRPDGSGLRTLSVKPAADQNDFQDVAVSPDGTRVAYRHSGPGVFTVRVLDLRTNTELVLPQPQGTAQFGGTFSPDGRSLVLIRAYEDSTVQLVVVPADGSGMGVTLGARAPFGPDGPTINGQSWSADGTAVIAHYDAEKLNRLLPIDGSIPIVLTRGEQAFGAAYQRLAP